MQQYIIPVNNEAFSRALVGVVGEENAKLVVAAYKLIDDAMAFGYAQGTKDAAEAAKDKTVREAEEAAYNDGYIDGVSDARVCPSDADARVAELCGDDHYEGDSGDENDYDPAEYSYDDSIGDIVRHY